MKIYAVKSNAARAAVSQGFTRADIAQNEQGDWYVAAPATPMTVEAAEALMPAAAVEDPEHPLVRMKRELAESLAPMAPDATDRDDDFAPPAFLLADESAASAADRERAFLEIPGATVEPLPEYAAPVAAKPAEPAEAPVATKTPSLRVSSVGFLAWLEEFLGKDTFAQISHPVVDAFKSAVEAVKPKAVSRRAKAPRTATPRKPGSTKLDQVAALLQRPEGCTRQDILDLTGWPSVTVPGMAAKAGLNLRQEKEGRAFRYWGTPIA